MDPRACGVDGEGGMTMVYVLGGSPRMRGRLFFIAAYGDVLGWIPAHAG